MHTKCSRSLSHRDDNENGRTSAAEGRAQTTNRRSDHGDRSVRAIAHRGCLSQYPENTLEAFRRSAAAVDLIELDVRRCGSGELVVFHDETLDRVTDTSGSIGSTPYEVLSRVSVLGSDEPVPRLVDVFETVPTDVGLNLELKDRDVARETVRLAAEYGHEVIVSSFYPDDVAAAREAGAPSVALLLYADSAYTSDEGNDGDFDVRAALDVADELECTYVHPSVELCLQTDIVERADERGFSVNAWTAEDAETVTELRARDVDGAVIDDCGLASRCRGE